jgi:enterochelin esterase-like enzyme
MPTVREQRDWPQGKVVSLAHHSEVLASNPWNDPVDREVNVYLPHDYNESGDQFVALWDLASYTSSGLAHLNWRNQGENLPQRLDRLIGQGEMPAAVVVMPDCYTSLGGNQYVNSASVGQYADYLVDELLPFVSARLNVVDSRDGRGLFGISSGGYGALFHAMQYPDTWGAAASHAGDMGFDLVYPGGFPTVCDVLARHQGDSEAFIRQFWSKNRLSGTDFTTLMTLAMAASYDPDLSAPARIRLPFDLHSCTLDADRWSAWMEYDPVQMVESGHDALRSLHALHIDVGLRDQYNLLYGTRRLAKRLQELEVDFNYEEFEGSHSSIHWRLDHSLPYLAKALKNASKGAN